MTMSPDKETHHPAEDETIVEPEGALPEMEFDELPPSLQKAMKKAGWAKLMPVQAKAMPYLFERRDLMVQSRTGSGKTGAFLMPLLERLDVDRKETQALILVPTRELANQVSSEAERIFADSRLRSTSIYGGVGYKPQLDALREGVQVIIGTPGRILDHLNRGTLKLDAMRVLIFDEADRLMSMGFYPDMRELRRYLPPRYDGYMFSATYPVTVQRLAGQFLHEPQFLSLSKERVYVAETAHIRYPVPAMDKDRALVRIIEVENPESAIIFCNTKMRVNYVARVLERFGYDADQLTSDLGQNAREEVLARLRKSSLRFLVATDIAGRGIDISELSHVIQYEVPEETEAYIHRAGRTGRAGATGISLTLVSPQEQTSLKRIAMQYKIDFEEREAPSDEEVARIVGERTTVMLEARLRDRDRLQIERMQRMLPLVDDLNQSEDERALLAMLLDDFYQQMQHAAPAHSVEEPRKETPSKRSGSGPSSGPSGGRSRRPRRRK